MVVGSCSKGSGAGWWRRWCCPTVWWGDRDHLSILLLRGAPPAAPCQSRTWLHFDHHHHSLAVTQKGAELHRAVVEAGRWHSRAGSMERWQQKGPSETGQHWVMLLMWLPTQETSAPKLLVLGWWIRRVCASCVTYQLFSSASAAHHQLRQSAGPGQPSIWSRRSTWFGLLFFLKPY